MKRPSLCQRIATKNGRQRRTMELFVVGPTMHPDRKMS